MNLASCSDFVFLPAMRLFPFQKSRIRANPILIGDLLDSWAWIPCEIAGATDIGVIYEDARSFRHNVEVQRRGGFRRRVFPWVCIHCADTSPLLETS